MEAPRPPQPPPLESGYRLTHRLGAGGMGNVYAGHKDAHPEPLPVAVKILRTDLPRPVLDQAVGMFHKEAVAGWRINHDHPNLVTIYDFGVMDDGLPYIVMEHVDGVSLDLLERGSQLDDRVVRRIACDVLAALDHLHASGLLHRDVTPRNILISQNGTVKLTDLGLVKDQQSERSAYFRGTPAYASPEALQGRRCTPSSDLYSFGSVLYELVTGMQPYGTGTPKQVIMAMVEDEYAPLPDEVPEDLAHLVRALTEFDPAERIYRTAADALDQLTGSLADDDELAALVARSPRPEPDPNIPELGWPFCERPPAPVPAPESAPPPRRLSLLTALALALLLSLGTLGVGFGLGRTSTTTESAAASTALTPEVPSDELISPSASTPTIATTPPASAESEKSSPASQSANTPKPTKHRERQQFRFTSKWPSP